MSGWGGLLTLGLGLAANKLNADQQAGAMRVTAKERQQYQQAVDQHEYFKQVYRPLEGQFIRQAQQLDDAAHINRIANKTNATNMAGLAAGLKSMHKAGFDPSRGAYQSASAQMISKGLAANAADMAKANYAARMNKVNALSNAVKLGRNINGAALKGLDTSANLASNTTLTNMQTSGAIWDGLLSTATDYNNALAKISAKNVHASDKGAKTHFDALATL